MDASGGMQAQVDLVNDTSGNTGAFKAGAGAHTPAILRLGLNLNLDTPGLMNCDEMHTGMVYMRGSLETDFGDISYATTSNLLKQIAKINRPEFLPKATIVLPVSVTITLDDDTGAETVTTIIRVTGTLCISPDGVMIMQLPSPCNPWTGQTVKTVAISLDNVRYPVVMDCLEFDHSGSSAD